MRSVVCWLWEGRGYKPEHVNVAHRMFRRHLSGDFRFICITDVPGEYDEGIEVMPIPEQAQKLAALQTPEGGHFPSCYRRLWMFSPEAKCLGDRVLLVDIDLVVVGDVNHLFDFDDDFVGWQPTGAWGTRERLGGGLYLMTPGTQTHVWDDFKGLPSIYEARRAGYRGSDQAWISYKMWGCRLFPSGIYSIRELKHSRRRPPKDAVLVQHNGFLKPWTSNVAWVRSAWH